LKIVPSASRLVGGFIVSFALPLVTTVIICAKSIDLLRDNVLTRRLFNWMSPMADNTASMNQMAPRRSNECKG